MEAQNDHVIIEPVNQNDLFAQQMAKIGLVGKPKYQGAPDRGYVRFISSGIKNPDYKVGDLVIIKNDVPDGFTIDGVGYFAIKHENILGKIVND